MSMEVYAAIQVAIVGVRTVIDRRPVGLITKTEQGWWLILPAMAVMTIVPIMLPIVLPIVVPILVPILVLVVEAIVAVVMSGMATVLCLVTGHRN